MKQHQTDVVIVGGGPTGLTMAYLLAESGVRSTVIERRSTRSGHPRAHMLNTRSMELFDAWGIADHIRDHAYPMEWEPFAMLVELGALTTEQQAEISPQQLMSCAQDQVEEGLFALVDARSEVSMLWSHDVRSVEDAGDSVTVTTECPDGEKRIEGRWLVAADGANSTVRDLLGVKMLGDPLIGSLIGVYFDGDIMEPGERPPLVSGSRNPEIMAAFISMDGKHRWSFNVFIDPTKESVEDYPADRCAQLIRAAWNARDDASITVHQVRPWTMTALVAERLRVGSVFLAGDAAHAFPPTGGFGMNSGIQDAHNLAWKLRESLVGRAGPALLESYEAERRPVACLNATQSLQNADRSDNSANPAPDFEVLASAATKSVRSGSLSAETDEERQRLEILEHGAAIGMDIGFAYDESPVIVPDGSERPDILVTRYITNACPGSRAPHLMVRHRGAEVSLLTVFEGSFSLLVAPGGADEWRAASTEADALVQPRLIEAGPGAEYDVAEHVLEDAYGIATDGAVLVRPDGHVAFRARTLPTNPSITLAGAIATALGRNDAGPGAGEI